jgi:thiosulfate dehydrogenase [quinone] large subunit
MSDVTSADEPVRRDRAGAAAGTDNSDAAGHRDPGSGEGRGRPDDLAGEHARKAALDAERPDGNAGVATDRDPQAARDPHAADRALPADRDPAGISPITRAERRAAEAQAAAERMGPGHFPGGFGQFVWALTRLAIGFVFLWAFLDKLFGLDRNTPKSRSWLDGGSPTSGYLSAVGGPFEDFFHRLAGQDWVDWVFMIGLAGIGLALILGIGVTIAAITGAALLLAMWLAGLPIDTNPFVDDHIVYALVIIGIAATGAGLRYSLAPWWRRTRLVRKLTFLR